MAYFGYSYWTSTPEYSLNRIARAIETRDVELFNKHVDVTTLTGRLIDDMLAAATKRDEDEESNEWSKLGQELGKGLVTLMKPRLAEIMKEQVEKFIETGDFGKSKEEEIQDGSVSLPELQKKLGQNLTEVKYSKKEGKIALVGIGIFNDRLQTELTLELKMREKEGGYWQLIEFANLSSLLEQIQKLEEAKLAEINRPTKEKMNLAVSVASIKKRSTSDSWGFNRKVTLSIQLQNRANVAVRSFSAKIEFRDLSDKLIKSYTLSFDRGIPPNSTQSGYWELETNRFISAENLLFETPESQLKYVFTPSEVTLADGSELKLKTSLD